MASTWQSDPMTPADHLNAAASILETVEGRFVDNADERDQCRYDLFIANTHAAIATAQATLHPYARRSAPVKLP
jgi:alcohol dehydrogenase class IV